ncbi:hypothetical protein CDAR_376611 [Caerostris darwini]|uniref:Uncharacterized protein n=1 Tax=Caerostris darwini TaxID=1538125 RepID=A0AAV4R6P9_9ARAC|nr:hypothetical protein CDAR_376611 [Caerostris darwini]
MVSVKPELAAGNRLSTFGKLKRLAAAAVAINSYIPNLSDIKHKLLDAFGHIFTIYSRYRDFPNMQKIKACLQNHLPQD